MNHSFRFNTVYDLPEFQLIHPNINEFRPNRWAENTPNATRIQLETAAIEEHFVKRGTAYTNEIKSIVSKLPPQSPEVRITLVIPTFNEQKNIRKVIAQLIRLERVTPALSWDVLFIVNAPYDETHPESEINLENLETTVNIIQESQSKFSHGRISCVSRLFPFDKAGVGMARTLGHDIALMRSLQRDTNKRQHAFYIQTMDADSPRLPSSLIKRVLKAIDDTDENISIIRLKGAFSKRSISKFPILHLLNILWEETFSVMSVHTDNPWTIGRGIVLQAYAHTIAGGGFGNEQGGAGEDIRIGKSIKALPGATSMDLPGIAYIINPRREILVLTEFITRMKNNPPFTRDLHEYARTLKSYLDFEDKRIRHSTELNLNISKHHKQEGLTKEVIEIMINSWWYLVRTEYSLYLLKNSNEHVQALYQIFATGDMTYPILQQRFNELEHQLYTKTYQEISAQIQQANEKAAVHIANILCRYGIVTSVNHSIPIQPPSMSPEANFHKALFVEDATKFKEILQLKIS